VLLDSAKLTRLADDVERLAARFDAVMSKSEYKNLVRERDEARQQLVDFTEANKNGATWNLGVFEKKYTYASERLAKAQVEMTKLKWQ
jgi:hypothetical protein